MPTTYEFTEQQTGTFTGVIQDGDGNPIGSNDLTTLTLTITNQADSTVINSRDAQNVLNANDVTLDVSGNLSWDIQAEDNIIVNDEIVPGTVERHEVLFEWTWGAGKSSSELYYFDVTQVDQIDTSADYIYGSIASGTLYFSKRSGMKAWDDATDTERLEALLDATRSIDRLNFKGDKTESTQNLEFPRGGDTNVPTNIEYATYEIANRLLDGVDIDMELELHNSSSVSHEGVRETYHRNSFPEWMAAGIISARAWLLIKPYLRDPRILTITRES